MLLNDKFPKHSIKHNSLKKHQRLNFKNLFTKMFGVQRKSCSLVLFYYELLVRDIPHFPDFFAFIFLIFNIKQSSLVCSVGIQTSFKNYKEITICWIVHSNLDLTLDVKVTQSCCCCCFCSWTWTLNSRTYKLVSF